MAVAFCWLVELSQLTGVPAYLSERSLLARLALGVAYDPLDMLWYPAGVLPLVAVHVLLRARATARAAGQDTDPRGTTQRVCRPDTAAMWSKSES
ncbi:DUF2809 domain-containing protein [Catellatospora coxensis]